MVRWPIEAQFPSAQKYKQRGVGGRTECWNEITEMLVIHRISPKHVDNIKLFEISRRCASTLLYLMSELWTIGRVRRTDMV